MRAWAWFVPACAITLWYVVHVCGMPFWQYYLLIAYPGISLALVRSYCEHQAAEDVEHRTIIVEASPFWSLLFLNNNLHVAHHTVPALAWYKIPAFYRAERDRADRPEQRLHDEGLWRDLRPLLPEGQGARSPTPTWTG